MPKHDVVLIVLNRAEGPSDALGNCGHAQVGSFSTAEAVLRDWAITAPDDGSVDKTDFTVVWRNGHTYSGTFGLKSNDWALAKHVTDFLAYVAKQKPSKLFSVIDIVNAEGFTKYHSMA